MKSIVIGSGFGGIAAALRLVAKKHEVTLIEKHPDLGGRARVFKRNDFTFDGGPTVITAPYLINELFELFNKNPEDYIKLTSLKTWYRFIFKDGLLIFLKRTLPLTILTAVIYLITLFYLNNSYEINESILKLIFIGLASLTFPHILLEYLLKKNEK